MKKPLQSRGADIVVCGAGIAGVATAYYLAAQQCAAPGRILLVDRLLPMSLTTSRSGENFRELWPQPSMTALMRRSLQLMQTLADEHPDAFGIRYSGYDFVSESAERGVLPRWKLSEEEVTGAVTRTTDARRIRLEKPYLAERIEQLVHIERAGALDVQALGQLLLRLAKRAGVEFCGGTISAIRRRPKGGFQLDIDASDGAAQINPDKLVLAAGPFVPRLAAMLGVELPLENTPQRKIVIPDPADIIPRHMPFTIFADPQSLNWSDEDRALLRDDPDYRGLLDELPAGLHIKPEGTGQIKLGWAYNRGAESPKWEIPDDQSFPSVVIRGASRFIPALAEYVERLPTPLVQYAGYYTRTPENWPIIGPLDEGLYAVAALSGYGTMAACGAGELCADWVLSNATQAYARHFHPNRYGDPAVVEEMRGVASDGQL